MVRGPGVRRAVFLAAGVARLAPVAGMTYAAETPFAEQLVDVQERMEAGDERALRIYETIGVYLGYTIPHYAEFCELRNLMVLGRVTSGAGGEVILETAQRVLADEFPDAADRIRITTPDEKMKRHGQAIAAASLPSTGA